MNAPKPFGARSSGNVSDKMTTDTNARRQRSVLVKPSLRFLQSLFKIDLDRSAFLGATLFLTSSTDDRLQSVVFIGYATPIPVKTRGGKNTTPRGMEPES